MSNITQFPNSKTVEFGGLTLHLRLTGKAILSIEKRLDKSLMSLFISGQGGMKLPPSNELLIVLQGANQKSGVKDSDIVEAFEKYLDGGNTTIDLQGIVQELLEEAGFFGKKTDGESEVEEETEAFSLEATPNMEESDL